MASTKYIGMDVHKDSISIAVMNAAGKIVMDSVWAIVPRSRAPGAEGKNSSRLIGWAGQQQKSQPQGGICS